ncbi:amylo-alpha-1,6-glucosidase [Ilumatobacter sp.]|uniref:amylo-alpha-1,6-glucosidase n=1 Tax=Ilumatobacter sp. TaxID=1967498 RepID=UPI003751AD1E
MDDAAVTPRIDKAVEINALATIEELGAKTGQTDPRTARLHGTASTSFARRFVRADGALVDVVDGPNGDDPALRPNQLLAASLPHDRWSTARS